MIVAFSVAPSGQPADAEHLPGDADEALHVLAAGHDEVEWVDEGDPSSRIRSTALDAALGVRDAAERGDVTVGDPHLVDPSDE